MRANWGLRKCSASRIPPSGSGSGSAATISPRMSAWRAASKLFCAAIRKAFDRTAPPTNSPSKVQTAAAAIRRDDKDSSLSRRAAQFGIFQRIAKPAHRLNKARVDFLAQAADKDLDRIGVAVEILIVEMFHQFGARHHLAAMMGEIGQQPVFLAGELHRIAVKGDTAGAGIDAQLADLDI